MKATTLRKTFEDAESNSTLHEAIAERAYEIYMERPADQGNPLEDWLQAERELTQSDAAAGSLRRRGIRRIGPDLMSK